MKHTKTVLLTLLSLLGVSTQAASLEEKPKIQIAIALDTSNSMDGLIHQAKTQLWRIVNEMRYASKFGEQPTLEVALYEYGKSSLPAAEGFLRQIRPMSRDLDLLSENLFALNTNGGEEYAGWVIRNATEDLVWDMRPESFRALYVAGNESFDQGPLAFRDAISEARKKDIIVNTIYAGHRESGVLDHWDEGAIIGLGAFMNIDPNHRRRIIPTPYDDDVKRINTEINDTYIPYGADGQAAKRRQEEQDANAGDFIYDRGASKSSGYYSNESWDLVDAVEQKRVDLETLDLSTLPEELRTLERSELRNVVAVRKQKRLELMAAMNTASSQRELFIDANQPADQVDTLDKVLIESLHEQLKSHGFSIEKK
jgi:hypothetical protein